MSVILPKPVLFQWDKGNIYKIGNKHGINNSECEEAFFDPGRTIIQDAQHSEEEERNLLFGKTKEGKLLVVAFTIRADCIRVISARKINKKEIKYYEKSKTK